MIDEESSLWQYLTPDERQLVVDGQLLIEDHSLHPSEKLSDYSYLVFPFAKLYEGFLKQLFRDLDIIADRDYRSDHFRIGKVLSPNLANRLGSRSAYGQLARRYGGELADRLWFTWRQSRNQVFHYFPHNYRALTQKEALERIELITKAMEEAVKVTLVKQERTS